MRKITKGSMTIRFSKIRTFLCSSFPKQILRKSFRLISLNFEIKKSDAKA